MNSRSQCSRSAILAVLASILAACATPSLVFPDSQLDYAETIPGFGGFFLDAYGRPTVYLTDPQQRPAAERALAAQLKARGFQFSDLVVRPAQYDYVQLSLWFSFVTEAAFAFSETVSVDLQESRQRILVDATGGEPARTKIDRALSALGVPAGAFAVEAAAPFTSMASLGDTVRPATGGLRITNNCTLGFNVSQADSRRTVNGRPLVRDRRPSFVTNSHCTDVAGGEEGTEFGQPRISGRIGVEVDDPDYWTIGPNCPDGSPCRCPAGELCRFSDAARVRYLPGVDWTLGAIARPTAANMNPTNPVRLEISGVFRITAEQPHPGEAEIDLMEGDVIHKVGKRTGWTFGPVANTCKHIRNADINRIILCSVTVAAGGGRGDSGAPVFSRAGAGSDVRLQGVLWGGDGAVYAFSPMWAIESELGALTTFDDTPTPATGRGADLVPEPQPGAGGAQAFCHRSSQGDLIVRVRNQSNSDALTTTTTRVAFSRGGSVSRETPAVPGGSFVNVAIPIPAVCRSASSCGFTISVDADLDIDERENGPDAETNNTAEGVCIN